MKKLKISILLLHLFLLNSFGQEIQIYGFLSDKESVKGISAAMIQSTNSTVKAWTDSDGFFMLKSKPNDTIQLVKPGYDTMQIILNSVDTVLNLSIHAKHQESIVEQDVADRNVVCLSGEFISKIPEFYGETDVFKSIHSLNGVLGEDQSLTGVNFRGTNTYNQQILVDGIELNHVGHLFGAVSALNSAMINSVGIHNGFISSEFGGKSGTVIDIDLKEGNMNKFHGEVSLNYLSESAVFEGPLKNGKSSMILTARRSNTDWLPDLLSGNQSNDSSTIVSFYDWSVKYKKVFKRGNKLTLTFFNSNDNVSNEKQLSPMQSDSLLVEKQFEGVKYSTTTGALNWNVLILPDYYSELTLGFSRYSWNSGLYMLGIKDGDGIDRIDYLNLDNTFCKLSDFTTKWKITYKESDRQKTVFGLSAVIHSVTTGNKISSYQDSDDPLFKIDHEGEWQTGVNIEFAMNADDEIRIGDDTELTFGLRMAGNVFNQNLNFSFEPRIKLSSTVLPSLPFSFSYHKTNQNNILLNDQVNGIASGVIVYPYFTELPLDLNQFTFSIQGTPTDQLKISSGFYYRIVNGKIEVNDTSNDYFKSVDDFVFNQTGTQNALGFDIRGDLSGRKLSGWVAYSFFSARENSGNDLSDSLIRNQTLNIHKLDGVALLKLNKNIEAYLKCSYIKPISSEKETSIPNDISDFRHLSYFPFVDKVENNQTYNSKTTYGYLAPEFFNINAGVDIHFVLKSITTTVAFGAQNVTNFKYPANLAKTESGDIVAGYFPFRPYAKISMKF